MVLGRKVSFYFCLNSGRKVKMEGRIGIKKKSASSARDAFHHSESTQFTYAASFFFFLSSSAMRSRFASDTSPVSA